MVNRARGEVSVEIGGKAYTLAMTLGALAELEDAFGADGFEAVFDATFAKLGAKSVSKFISAVAAGNRVEIPTDDIADMMPSDAIAVVQRIIEASGMVERRAAEGDAAGADPLPMAPAVTEVAGASG